jgi:hypothetical protein
VKLIVQHSANIGAKKGYFTGYPVLKVCVKLKTVCARTVRLSVPVIYLDIARGFPRTSPKYGIELPASIRMIRVEAIQNLGNF